MLAPRKPVVVPVAVEAVGDVKNPHALVNGGGVATLTTRTEDQPASVILDFGKEIAGQPFIDIARIDNGATLALTTAEARSFFSGQASTLSAAPALPGDTQIRVVGTDNFQPGKRFFISPVAGPGANHHGLITAVDEITKTISFTPALTQAIPPGHTVGSQAKPGPTPRTDEDPALAGSGGTDTLNPSGSGRADAKFHGGFRFLAVTLTNPGTVDLSHVGVNFQGLRATPKDYRGWFLSSDDELNRMWYSGAYTVQTNLKPAGLNDLPDARVYDGAKRDRSIWTGDLIVQVPTLLSTLGKKVGAAYLRSTFDILLAAQDDEGQLPGSPDFLKGYDPDGSPFYYSNNYSGFGVRAIIDYFRYTGDSAYVAKVLPALRRELEYNQNFLNENNLVVSNDRDYWQAVQNGEVTKYSIDYYVLLREMAWLERQLGTEANAGRYDATADAIRKAIIERLWNDRLGAYGQSSEKPDVLVEDANALALQYGLVPKGRKADVLAALKTLWTPHGAVIGPGLHDPTGHTIEPFGNGMETAGRFAVGDSRGALELMRRTWGKMLDKADPLYTGTFWEFKNNDGGVNRVNASLAHGWAASPTIQLTQEILGVRPVAPGYRTWSVQPKPSGLKWAKGAVPTAHGKIRVDWRSRFKARKFTTTVKAPRGTAGTIAVPARRVSTVTVNGRTAYRNGRGLAFGAKRINGFVVLKVRGGRFSVRVR